MAQKQIDVLAVGNVVTDVFIRLLDSEATVEKGSDGLRLSMAYAAKVPFDHSEVVPAVGNASNAAVSFAKLGLDSGLVANVGGDAGGREIIEVINSYTSEPWIYAFPHIPYDDFLALFKGAKFIIGGTGLSGINKIIVL